MNSSQLDQNISTQKIDQCPECGSSGKIYITDCQDLICKIPGSWTFYQCSSCQSLWLNPSPTPDSIPKLYTNAYHFTHGTPSSPLTEPTGLIPKVKFAIKLGIWMQAFGYEQLERHTSIPHFIRLGRLISFLPGQRQRAGYSIRFLHNRNHDQHRLLEVGTGNGSFLWLMHHLGWEVEGLEPDPLAAQSAQETGLTIIPQTVEAANLSRSHYDAIVLHHVLEHLPDHQSVVKKLVSSLKPGGVLVSISPNPTGIISKVFKESWYALDAPRHLSLPSPDGYRKLFQNENVSVKVHTTMQIIFWMCRESLSIQKTGQVSSYNGSLLPQLSVILGSLLSVFNPYLGEEVICVATKN